MRYFISKDGKVTQKSDLPKMDDDRQKMPKVEVKPASSSKVQELRMLAGKSDELELPVSRFSFPIKKEEKK